MSKIRKSLYQSVGGKYATLIIDTIMVISISRLLTPSEIGVYSVCAVIMGFAGIIRNTGLPEYIIQEKELTEARSRSCFGAMLLVCWTIGILLIIFREELANYYHEPQMQGLILIMVIEFFLSPIGICTRALLRRNFDFGFLFNFNLTESIVKAIISIALAVLNYSYYSLAIGTLSGFIASLILLLLFKRKYINFIPGFSEFRHVLKFGLPSLGTSTSIYLDRHGPELIIASSLGFVPVALFNRAMSLRELFEKFIFAGVSPVVLPAFSEVARNKGDIKEVYLKMQSYLLVIAWPFFGVLAMSSLPVLNVFFGDQWDAAQDLVAILCLAGAFWTATCLIPALIKSIGKINELFKYQSVLTIFRLVGVVYAASFDITYVAWVFVITSAINSFFYMGLAKKFVGIKLLEVIQRNLKNLIVTIITVSPAYFIASSRKNLKWSSIEELGIIVFSSTIIWFTLLYIVKHPIRLEFNIVFKTILEKLKRYFNWKVLNQSLRIFFIIVMILIGVYFFDKNFAVRELIADVYTEF